jgi:hypothetical protein
MLVYAVSVLIEQHVSTPCRNGDRKWGREVADALPLFGIDRSILSRHIIKHVIYEDKTLHEFSIYYLTTEIEYA